MQPKYWVPALEKGNAILTLLVEEPSALKLIDLSKRLGINKSSMFSLLTTMEELQWVTKSEDGTYALGSKLGYWGTAFFKQYQLVSLFHKEALHTKHALNETVQLAVLEGNEVLYLAKEEMPSPVKLTSEPGKKFPAHATALGKAMLSGAHFETLHEIYPEEALYPQLTPYTLKTRASLFNELQRVRDQGYACDEQEIVIGFCCAAAPIYGAKGKIIAAVSASMPLHEWNDKRNKAIEELKLLANRLSGSTLE